MKSVVIIDPSRSGGICHYSFALCRALAAAGSRVSLVTSPGAYELDGLKREFEIVPLLEPEPAAGSLPKKLARRLSAKLRPNGWTGKKGWAKELGRRVGRYVQSQEAQVVHQQWIQSQETEPVFWESLRRQMGGQVPLVYTAHNVWPHESTPQTAEQYRVLYSLPDRLIVHGEMLRRQIIDEAGADAQKLRVIPHGSYHYLADAVPPVPQAEARERLGLPGDARVVLFFGAIRPYKGLDVLLLAFERLLRRRTGIDYRLLIAGRLWGETWDKSLYSGLCRSLKITDAVQVHEEYIALNDLGLFFGAADAVCLPYRSASQSGSLQLAYSYRKPVIAATVGSLPEAVLEGQTGLLVAPEDPEALAEALAALLDHPVECRHLGSFAYDWSREHQCWEQIAAQTLQVYSEAR